MSGFGLTLPGIGGGGVLGEVNITDACINFNLINYMLARLFGNELHVFS